MADMSSLQQVRGLAADLLGRYPRIDVLVNNVGDYWNTRHVTTRSERSPSITSRPFF